MAGAMYNALEMVRGAAEDMRKFHESNHGWIPPGRIPGILAQLGGAQNVLRVGLKARFQRERPTIAQQERFGIK